MRCNRCLIRCGLTLGLLLGAAAGWAAPHVLWPWGAKVAVAPEWVHELQVTAPAGEAMPVVLQFWDHNTLVMDLQEVPASGQIRLSPSEGGHWPARIGFRMSSRRFQQLEVRGAQRIVLNVAGEGTPVTAELPPGIYDAGTPELRIGWGGDGTF